MNLKDRLIAAGYDITKMSEIQQHEVLQTWYVIDKNFKFTCLSPDGSWSSRRGDFNQARGDSGSRRKRKMSVNSVGIVLNLRKGPWIKDRDPSIPHDKFQVEHWATLLEGAHDAFTEDLDQTNMVVQKSVRTAIEAATLYDHRMPSDASRFNVYIGNLLNKEVTIETIIEYLEASEIVESGWNRKKKQNSWSLSSISQGELDVRKFEYIKAVYPHFWKDYRSYEITQIAFSKAKDTTVDCGSAKGQNLWVSIKQAFKAEIDFDKIMNHELCLRIFYEVIRRFRLDYSHRVVDILFIYFPRNADSPFGKCSLAEVPNPANANFRTEQLDDMLLKMQGSSIIRDTASADPKEQSAIQKVWSKNRQNIRKVAFQNNKVQEGQKEKTEKPCAKVKAAKKQAVTSPSKGKEDSQSGLEFTDFDVDPTMPWLTILDHAMGYLLKINESVALPLLTPYSQITLALATLPPNQCFPMSINSTKKQVRGFKALFKLLRLDIYRRASLQPRPSDLDFTGLSTQEALTETAQQIDQETAATEGGNSGGLLPVGNVPVVPPLSAEEFLDKVQGTFAATLQSLKGFLSNQDISQPFQCQTVAATTMCQVMMKLQGEIAARGGSLDSAKGAFALLVRTVAAEVTSTLSPSMSALVQLLDKAQADGLSDRIDSGLLMIIKDYGFNHAQFIVYRTKLFAYLLSSLGQQKYPLQLQLFASATVPVSYIEPLGREILDELVVKADSTDLIATLETWIKADNSGKTDQSIKTSFIDVAVHFGNELWTIIDASGGTDTSFRVYSCCYLLLAINN